MISLENLMDTQNAREERIRVLVVDNTRIHTQLLADALSRDRGLDVNSGDSDSHGLIAAAVAHKTDVLLISSNLDEEPHRAFEVLRELRASHPQIRAVVLLDSSKRDFILHAFRAGARGIFSRHDSVESLCKCVRTVHEGQIWASSLQMSFAVEALAASPTVRAVDANGLDLLSKRELQIVRSLAEGLTNREIAERLNLSQHTVKNYLFRVFDKLGVSSRVELLFMTLAAAGTEPVRKKSRPSESAASADDFGMFLQSTESGLPFPQLALAQMYVSLQKEPRDVVQAYAWYLLAADGGTQVKVQMEKAMTSKQIEEAHEKAKSWLARLHPSGTVPQAQPAAKPPRPVEGLPQPSRRRENEKAKAASQL